MFFARAHHRSNLRRRPPARLSGRWLRLDRLEDRTVPTAIQWSGGPNGTGSNWLDPSNWAGGVLPGPNDDVVIAPANPAQLVKVPINGLANADIRSNNGGGYPVAPVTLEVGSVPFDLVPLASVPDSLGVIEAPHGESVFTVSTNVAHPTVVYTLMNSAVGNIGDDIASIEFVGANRVQRYLRTDRRDEHPQLLLGWKPSDRPGHAVGEFRAAR